jgi:hypothetical protein
VVAIALDARAHDAVAIATHERRREPLGDPSPRDVVTFLAEVEDRVEPKVERVVLVGRRHEKSGARRVLPDHRMASRADVLGCETTLARSERTNDRANDGLGGHGGLL